MHDTNAFVRSKVLQIWKQLCEAKVMYFHHHNIIIAQLFR